MSRRLTALAPGQVHALTLASDPYLSCERCFDLVDAYAESVAIGRGDDVPAGLREHLAACAACAEEAEALLELLGE